MSIYDPSELDRICDLLELDIVQAPFNLLDRRIQESGWLRQLSQSGVEVHVRSVFLQGLLLLKRSALPSSFHPWKDIFTQWHDWLEEHQADPIKSCLASVNDYFVNRIIVGVNSEAQFRQVIQATNTLKNISLPDLSSNDENLINPTKWPR